MIHAWKLLEPQSVALAVQTEPSAFAERAGDHLESLAEVPEAVCARCNHRVWSRGMTGWRMKSLNLRRFAAGSGGYPPATN